MPDTYPDDALFFADEAYFKALVAYEQDQRLWDELKDGLAEELGYDSDELETDNLEMLADYGIL